jgi:PAS domain-containing protein
MAQQPIELILVRHLASRLAVPVFVVDATGDMVYFNGPAGDVLGRPFDEINVMRFDDWTTAFRPTSRGRALDVDDIPLVRALRQSTPVHGPLEILGADGVTRPIEVTAYPIVPPSGEVLGAVAMFWETAAR